MAAVFYSRRSGRAAKAEIGACFALDRCGEEKNVVGHRPASAPQRGPGNSERRFPRIGAGVGQQPIERRRRKVEIREVEQVIEADIGLQRELFPNRVRPPDV